jgi:hypothetical protein
MKSKAIKRRRRVTLWFPFSPSLDDWADIKREKRVYFKEEKQFHL